MQGELNVMYLTRDQVQKMEGSLARRGFTEDEQDAQHSLRTWLQCAPVTQAA